MFFVQRWSLLRRLECEPRRREMVIVSTGRLRHTHWWSAVIRCQNTGDGVRFRASH